MKSYPCTSKDQQRSYFLRGRDGGEDFRMKGGAVDQRCSGGVWARLTSETQYPRLTVIVQYYDSISQLAPIPTRHNEALSGANSFADQLEHAGVAVDGAI